MEVNKEGGEILRLVKERNVNELNKFERIPARMVISSLKNDLDDLDFSWRGFQNGVDIYPEPVLIILRILSIIAHLTSTKSTTLVHAISLTISLPTPNGITSSKSVTLHRSNMTIVQLNFIY